MPAVGKYLTGKIHCIWRYCFSLNYRHAKRENLLFKKQFWIFSELIRKCKEHMEAYKGCGGKVREIQFAEFFFLFFPTQKTLEFVSVLHCRRVAGSKDQFM